MGKIVNGISVGEVPFTKNTELLIKENAPNKQGHASLIGRFAENRHVYKQTFIIRSYEIGPDKTATMETLMNLLEVGFLYKTIIYRLLLFLSANIPHFRLPAQRMIDRMGLNL